jgi:hypothetical protein
LFFALIGPGIIGVKVSRGRGAQSFSKTCDGNLHAARFMIIAAQEWGADMNQE